MKASFALLALLISFLCFAQEPDHFNNNSSMWYVAKTYPNATPQYPAFAETKTTVFRLPADTMINGSLWFKVIGSDDSLSLVNPVLKGFIQSNGDTVLYRTPGGQVVILYNFNLSIGDSVLYDFGYFSSYIHVINIDTFTTGAHSLKRIHFSEPDGPIAFDVLNEVWIEGIGSIHGPLFPSAPKKFSTEMADSALLTCSFSEGVHWWHHPSYSHCMTNIILGENKYDQSGISLYPNPFDEYFYVEMAETGNVSIHIFNALGENVSEFRMKGAESMIQLKGLPSGFYFVMVQRDQHVLFTKGMIKKN